MNTSLAGTAENTPQNDFKAFATGPGANVMAQEEYEKSGFLKEGFKKGMARSSEINKAIRQGSAIAAAIARFTANKTGENLLDNGDIATLSQHIETAIGSVSSSWIAEAQGEADQLTAIFSPVITDLKNGKLIHIRAKDKNRTKTPSLKVDQKEAKPIVKGNNLSLEVGDIAGSGHWLELQYDEALDKWVLQNPAKGITSQSGVPVGTIEYFAMATPPAGYLKANGAAVGRETYAELFAAIGTTYGEGDGSTTFNLPDLIDRFAQGSNTPGQKIEAGLPNITGSFDSISAICDGAFASTIQTGAINTGTQYAFTKKAFNASRFNPIYGASNTVQPPALTLLPCIKAFDAATNPGLIDITELANEMAGKVDRYIDSKPVRYVIDAYNDGTNWYRKWSDGWIEQGGIIAATIATITITFLAPFADNRYCILKNLGSGLVSGDPRDSHVSFYNLTPTTAQTLQHDVDVSTRWYSCGEGA